MSSQHPEIKPLLQVTADCRQVLIDHCLRKLSGRYIAGEDRNLKAFGLVAGVRRPESIQVSRCFPLLRNARHQECHREFMDQMMTDHAIPSETPLHNRGWVAEPEELTEVVKCCSKENLQLIGTYHMHRVAWEHDRIRDTPTKLDTILGYNSRLIMFIVSMVEPERPLIRAFNEGRIEDEYPIHYI